MKAAYYDKPGQGRIAELPYPQCGDDEVIIKVVAAAYCKGAELEHDTPEGTGPGRYPVVPGHEFSGIVHEVGRFVTGWKIGDRVTADNTVYCMSCDACHRGDYSSCANMGSLGHNINGGFAEYTKVKHYKLYKLPDHVSFNAASFTEMIACCIFAVDQAEIRPGEAVAITGLGAAASILAQLLKSAKVRDVVVIGSTQSKLDRISAKGIQTVLMDRRDYAKHHKAALALHPEGYDAVIDTSANMALLSDSMKLLRQGGRLCEFGVPKGGSISLERNYLVERHLSYRPVGNQHHCFSRALTCLSEGIVDGDGIVTATLPLEQYFEGLELLRTDGSQLKVIVRPSPEIKAR